MAYVTGTASSFSDLKSQIEAACTDNGWTLSSGILSKGGVFFQLVADTQDGYDQLRLHGGTSQTGATLNDQPPSGYGAKICSTAGHVVGFPITYHISVFAAPDEVYCVINYNSDFYQQLSFGRSDVPGIGGSGAWFTGAKRSDLDLLHGPNMIIESRFTDQASARTYGLRYTGYCGGLFFDDVIDANNWGCAGSSFVHVGLDSTQWRSPNSEGAGPTGYRGAGTKVGSLLMQLPSLFNSANVLLPIKPVAVRYSGGVTIIANPKNARYLRVDNVSPGEVITFGADRWKCFPFFKKDTAQRNGDSDTSGAAHSGTFGYAIRYDGP